MPVRVRGRGDQVLAQGAAGLTGRQRGRLGRAAADPVYGGFRRAFSAMGTGYPRVAVYVGAGASHSWMWYADLLERIGLLDVTFVDETSVTAGGLAGYSMLLVGGGDTYAMASGIGREGAGALDGFVRGGGLYHGSCAGGYLVLSGVDMEPFTAFDLVEGEMVNVMESPPEPRCLEHKYLAPYGSCLVFHPVYGEVLLGPGPGGRDLECFAGGEIAAPLFGGPVMAGEDSVADYRGLTRRAAYLWEPGEAAGLMVGRQAVFSRRRGRGTAIASGPHLEHPLFPRANALLAGLFLRHVEAGAGSHGLSAPGDEATRSPGEHAAVRTGVEQRGARRRSSEVDRLLEDIRREVSNARIVGFGLEKIPVTWRIGVKVWEPEKIRVFLDYAWRRLPYLFERADGLTPERLEPLARGYREVTALTRSLKTGVESGSDSVHDAQLLLTRLKELTAGYLSLCFELRLEQRGGRNGTSIRENGSWPAE